MRLQITMQTRAPLSVQRLVRSRPADARGAKVEEKQEQAAEQQEQAAAEQKAADQAAGSEETRAAGNLQSCQRRLPGGTRLRVEVVRRAKLAKRAAHNPPLVWC